MQRAFFDKELIENRARIVLCPSCNNKLDIDLEETEIVCEECETTFDVEASTEEFVWHPSQDY